MNEGDRHAPFADPGRDALDRSRSHVARGEDPGKVIADWTLTSLREKLIKIGAKVVGHARYVAFQMAEVASVTRSIETTGEVCLDDRKFDIFQRSAWHWPAATPFTRHTDAAG